MPALQNAELQYTRNSLKGRQIEFSLNVTKFIPQSKNPVAINLKGRNYLGICKKKPFKKIYKKVAQCT
jgi:hypothetical protein